MCGVKLKLGFGVVWFDSFDIISNVFHCAFVALLLVFHKLLHTIYDMVK